MSIHVISLILNKIVLDAFKFHAITPPPQLQQKEMPALKESGLIGVPVCVPVSCL